MIRFVKINGKSLVILSLDFMGALEFLPIVVLSCLICRLVSMYCSLLLCFLLALRLLKFMAFDALRSEFITA